MVGRENHQVVVYERSVYIWAPQIARYPLPTRCLEALDFICKSECSEFRACSGCSLGEFQLIWNSFGVSTLRFAHFKDFSGDPRGLLDSFRSSPEVADTFRGKHTRFTFTGALFWDFSIEIFMCIKDLIGSWFHPYILHVPLLIVQLSRTQA